MSDNDRAPSASGFPDGPPAGGGWRELIEDAAESHAAAQSLVALLLGDLERSERYKVELLERVSSAERRVAEQEQRADNFLQQKKNLDAALKDAWQQNESLLARVATEREEHREMYERQAAAVRHHTDRADALERRVAELEAERDKQVHVLEISALMYEQDTAVLARDLAAARKALKFYADPNVYRAHLIDGGQVSSLALQDMGAAARVALAAGEETA